VFNQIVAIRKISALEFFCSGGIKFQLIYDFQQRGVIWKFKGAEQEISKE